MEQFTRETERLILKVMTLADLPAFYDIMKKDEVGRWMGTGRAKTIDEVRERIEMYQHLFEERGYGCWGVFLKSSGIFIGQAGLLHIPVDEVGIVYAFAPEQQGKGYGTEAVAATLKFAFVELRRPRVYAHTRLTNDRSRHVLEKNGMHYVGVGDFQGIDMHGYVITKEQWENEKVSI